MEMKYVVNLGDMVTVELTEEGKRVEESHYKNLGLYVPYRGQHRRAVYSLYELMSIFGKSLEHIGPPLFVNNEVRFGSSL